MFAKMVLPVLGGSPSVWAVAIFFFQAALLVGYCYAHLLIAHASPPHDGRHPSGRLPAGVSGPADRAAARAGASRRRASPICGSSACSRWRSACRSWRSSANAPLLQAWFARTGHPHGHDPYFLYAASNLGSLIALLGYPFVLEPAFGLKAAEPPVDAGLPAADGRAWRWCFVVMRSLPERVGVRGAAGAPAAAGRDADVGTAVPTWADRLGWIGLALVPSALLTAFTTHVTTDVASAPLLWVLPLSLYLLTFVLVFRDKPLIPRDGCCCSCIWPRWPSPCSRCRRPSTRPGSSPRPPASRCSSPRPWWRIARSTRRGPRPATSPSSICGCRSAARSAACSRR